MEEELKREEESKMEEPTIIKETPKMEEEPIEGTESAKPMEETPMNPQVLILFLLYIYIYMYVHIDTRRNKRCSSSSYWTAGCKF